MKYNKKLLDDSNKFEMSKTIGEQLLKQQEMNDNVNQIEEKKNKIKNNQTELLNKTKDIEIQIETKKKNW